MTRETKKVTAPITGKVFELKTYVTGREKRELTNTFLKGMTIDGEGKIVGGFNATTADAASELAWKTIIVSVDGKPEGECNIVDAILDLPLNDFTFIKNAVEEVTSDKQFEEKKRN